MIAQDRQILRFRIINCAKLQCRDQVLQLPEASYCVLRQNSDRLVASKQITLCHLSEAKLASAPAALVFPKCLPIRNYSYFGKLKGAGFQSSCSVLKRKDALDGDELLLYIITTQKKKNGIAHRCGFPVLSAAFYGRFFLRNPFFCQ